MSELPKESDTFDVFFHAYKPKTGDTVVEVGAGVGYETAFLSDWVGPDGLVVAVEANPVEYDNLLTKVYNRPNVKPVNAAALDYNGVTKILRAGQRSFIHDHPDSVTVHALTLDLICADLPHIDFLKMNIEGSEVAALKGFTEGLQRTKNVMVSCHDFFGYPTKTQVRELLTEAGFTVSHWEEAEGAWARDYLYATQ